MAAPGEPATKAPAWRKRYGGGTVKKSEGIRRDVRLGKLRFESKYQAIKYFYKRSIIAWHRAVFYGWHK